MYTRRSLQKSAIVREDTSHYNFFQLFETWIIQSKKKYKDWHVHISEK